MNSLWCWFSLVVVVIQNFFPCIFSEIAVEVSPDGKIQNRYGSCLHDQNLVKESIVHDDIVSHHNKSCSGVALPPQKQDEIRLGYVTPWNRVGYRLSLEYAQKYTHLSPAWFQIKRYGASFMIFGENEIDKIWMDNIRKRSSTIKIVPRIYFGDDWTLEEAREVLYKKGLQHKMIAKIVQTLNTHGFDGAVIELPIFFNWLSSVIQKKQGNSPPNDEKPQVDPRQYASEQRRVTAFIKRIGLRFHRENKAFLIVISPFHLGLVKPEIIYKEVAAVSLMTYDFGSISLHGAGPISPYGWLQQVLSVGVNELKLNAAGMKKLLIGFNFYGYEYSPVPETAGEGSLEEIFKENTKNPSKEYHIVTYESLLKNFIDEAEDKNDWVWKWDDTFKEHSLYNPKKQKKVWYPSLKSISDRLELVRQAGAGVAIWELGQGFQYFNELL